MIAIHHRFVLACLLAAMAWCAVASAHADGPGAALARTHMQARRQFIPGGLALPHAPSHVVAVTRPTAEPSA